MAEKKVKQSENKIRTKRLIVIVLIVLFVFTGVVLSDQIYNTPIYDWFGGVLKKEFVRTGDTYQGDNLQAFAFMKNKIYTYGSVGLLELTNRKSVNHDIKYTNPVIDTRGSYMLIYDNGGLNMSLFKNSRMLYTKTFTLPITKARVNQSGDVSLITKEPGYKSICTVFDKRGKELYYIGSGDSYIIECNLMDDGKKLFLSTSNFSLEGIKSVITLYDLDQEEGQVIFSSESTIFTNITILEQNTLVAIGDNQTVGMSIQGKEKWRYDYNKLPLKTFSTNSSSHVAFVLNDTYDHLVTVDKNGKIKQCTPKITEIKNVDIIAGRVLISSTREAALYSTSCAEISSTNINRDIFNARLISGGNKMAVIYGNSVDIYKIK